MEPNEKKKATRIGRNRTKGEGEKEGGPGGGRGEHL